MEQIKDYVSYPERITHYNTSKMPLRQKRIYTALMYAASKLLMPRKITGYKIEKINMEGLKPPYILLCNHMRFVDFQLNCIATYPHRVNNIATIDGYRGMGGLMEQLGCICKRKFTTDVSLVKACYKVLHEYGDILSMYPEARYSPIGTTAILPDSMGKLIKKCGVPVVVLLHHGNYLHTPFWDYRKPRRAPLYSTMTRILTAEEVKALSSREINDIVRQAMQYDEYRWQKDKEIEITEPFRAENLNKVLYQCPECKTEYKMNSEGAELFCEHCGKRWQMTELGELRAKSGETHFSHIPDWYEWQRAQVRRQIEDGTYFFRETVEVMSLPWTKSFIDIGRAVLTHSADGFTLEGEYNGEKYRIHRQPQSMYGVHIEYAFVQLNDRDCIDISTRDDSFYCMTGAVTKLSLATEEIYKYVTEGRAAKKSKA